MPIFTYDGVRRRITEIRQVGDPTPVRYNMLEVYGDGMEWWHQDANSKYTFPLRLQGNSFRRIGAQGESLYSTAEIFLQNQPPLNWRFEFADYSHEVIFTSANLYRGDENENLFDLTNLSSSVHVTVENQVSDINTLAVEASAGATGLTNAQINQIADLVAARAAPGIWTHPERELTNVAPNAATAESVLNTYSLLAEIGGKVDTGDIRLSSTQLGRIASAVWAQNERTVQLPTVEVAGLVGAIWAASSRGASLDAIYAMLGLKGILRAHSNAEQVALDGAITTESYIEFEGRRLDVVETVAADGQIDMTQTPSTP